ncbi:hypothetical protein [Streptomyces sp. NPDC095613]|uniref:hypothetical protein n=1 Tax=Streptomyces sp. NPDC095613 TaxID=3155540 RepID=UPI003319BB8B
MTTDPTARTSVVYDAIDAFQRTHRLPGLQHAQIRGLLAEHLARVLPLAEGADTASSVDGAALRGRIAEAPTEWIDGHPQLEAIAAAVWEQCGRSDSGVCVEDDPRNIAVAALAAVLSTLPGPADRATVLEEAIRRVEDPAERAKTSVGMGLGWESARDVLLSMLAEARRSTTAESGRTSGAVVHGCPPDGSGLTPCCGRTPFELPRGDRISVEAPATCTGAAPGTEA